MVIEMNALMRVLREMLIGIVAMQSLLLPQGNCCCAVRRVLSVLVQKDDVPLCCRLLERTSSQGEDPLGTLDGRDPVAECQCGAGKVAAQQASTLRAAEDASARESAMSWADVWVLYAAPVHGDRFGDTALPISRPSGLSLSGRAFRIPLQSWLC